MKKIFLLILFFAALKTQAQYFQEYFNEVVTARPIRAEAFNDGLKSRVNFVGGNPAKFYFAATGYSEINPPPPSGPDARLRFTKTNSAGTVNVNLGYQFADATPSWFNSRGFGICEIDNGNGTGGYVIVGQVSFNPNATSIPGGSDMFFGKFNNAGTPTFSERIDVGKGADVATGVIRSLFKPGTFLVCGYSEKDQAINAVVARISSTGAVIWLRSLNMSAGVQCNTTSQAIASGLCEDPQTGTIYVCGKVSGHKTSSADPDGLVFALTPAGDPIWQVYHDLGGAADEYHDIKFTSDGNIVVCGFSTLALTGGTSPASAFYDVWLSLFRPSAMPGPAGLIWTYKHRFASPLQQTKGYRVIEKKHAPGTAPGTTYYVVGPVYDAAGGSPLQMMLEVPATGTAGTYHTYPPPYGPLGFDNRFGLDSVETTTPYPGLAIFSSTIKGPTGSQSNSYLLKTYYNGAACNNLCNAFPDNIFQLPPHNEMSVCKDTVYRRKKLVFTTYKYDSSFICSQKKIRCGKTSSAVDNIAAPVAYNAQAMLLSPNPANSKLNVAVAGIKNGIYKAELIDVNGRVISSLNIQLYESNSVNINVGGLSKGYYILKLTGDGKVWSQKFMKE